VVFLVFRNLSLRRIGVFKFRAKKVRVGSAIAMFHDVNYRFQD